MCPWGKTLLERETEQMVKLSIQLRILACISQKQEKELMLENSLDKEGIVLQTQRLSTGCVVSTACTQRCRIDSSSLKSFTNHRTAMQSKVQAFHAPCKMLQPRPPWKKEGVGESAEVRGQPSPCSTEVPQILLSQLQPGKENRHAVHSCLHHITLGRQNSFMLISEGST